MIIANINIKDINKWPPEWPTVEQTPTTQRATRSDKLKPLEEE